MRLPSSSPPLYLSHSFYLSHSIRQLSVFPFCNIISAPLQPWPLLFCAVLFSFVHFLLYRSRCFRFFQLFSPHNYFVNSSSAHIHSLSFAFRSFGNANAYLISSFFFDIVKNVFNNRHPSKDKPNNNNKFEINYLKERIH